MIGSALWPNETQRVTACGLMRAAGMEPDSHQQRVATTAGDQLVLCHRQFGKSTIAGSIALEDASEEPGALVLLISRSMRQSGELFRKVKDFYNLTQPLPLIQDSMTSLELSNHSRIISLPGSDNTIVGFSKVKRVILDEAARIPDMTYYALRPMLAMSGGSILALSTPYGRRGWFYEACEGVTVDDGKALDRATVEALLADLGITVADEEWNAEAERSYAWTRTRVTAPENPRLSKRFLANERRSIPDLVFRQEWLCEFLETGETVFRYEDVEAMLHGNLTPFFSPQDIYGQDAARREVQPFAAGNGVWR